MGLKERINDQVRLKQTAGIPGRLAILQLRTQLTVIILDRVQQLFLNLQLLQSPVNPLVHHTVLGFEKKQSLRKKYFHIGSTRKEGTRRRFEYFEQMEEQAVDMLVRRNILKKRKELIERADRNRSGFSYRHRQARQ